METVSEYTLADLKREVSNEKGQQEHSDRMQLIIFKLGNEEYGLSIEQIKEVVLTPRIAHMPQTPDYIKGVANIRGNIIAIMDLEKRFGMTRSEEDPNNKQRNYSLVVENDKYKVGILVKEVPNTLSVRVNDIDTASNFVQFSSINNDCFTGVVKSGERMIILVDLIKLIASENFKEHLTK